MTNDIWKMLLSFLPSEQRSVISRQHGLPYQRNGWAAVFQKLIVKRLPRLPPSARSGPVVSQFSNHQLAHRVVEVSRIKRAARGLLTGRARVLITLFAKHAL